MRVIAFVGPSGTGKSYRSVMVSQQYGADAIIDDGLLISHGKVIAGTSAKKEPTKNSMVFPHINPTKLLLSMQSPKSA